MKWADPRNSAERLTYTEEAPERILGNCGLMGVCDESGDRMSGELAVRSMAAFKGVGFPEEIGEFYRLEEYQGWTWSGHGRFPTNTPGWLGWSAPVCRTGLQRCP